MVLQLLLYFLVLNKILNLFWPLTFHSFFSNFFISFFSTNAIILIFAASYFSETLSVKDLGIKILRSCIRLFFTMFYTTILVIGYFFFCLSMSTPLFYSMNDFLKVVAFAILSYIIYLYISIVWVLALVVSAVEEGCYGIMALGKAGKIIKGNEMKGFILNILFNLLALMIFQGTQIVHNMIIMLILVNVCCLWKVFQLVAYTVLYIDCKKNQGDEIIEFQGSIDYSKISNLPLIIDGTPYKV
uniref:Uncharacterized protein n=1 Tax=Nicotiana tabacum TaxID=4097 RepID=A0A1S4A1B8_TOBAC|nr:PREDICTED: uncharacterized protein LOC107792639 [Nicotiana tabacum]